MAEIGNRGSKRFGDANNAEKARIANAAFDSADVGRIEIGFFGEGFLCEVACLTQLADVEPESGEGTVTRGHVHSSPGLGL